MPERLKSRKLWITISSAVLFALNGVLELGLDEATIQNIALAISAYLVGQSAVDYGQTKERSHKYAAWMAASLSTGEHERGD